MVYRHLDIGTAKPSPRELGLVPHHLVDILDPKQPYTAGDFRRDVELALRDIHSRGARALIVGGTGFYLKALTHGMWDAPKSPPELRARLEAHQSSDLFRTLEEKDPAAAQKIGPGDRYRLVRALELIETTGQRVSELEKNHATRPVAPHLHLLVIDRETEELEKRIADRTDQMLQAGLLDEVSTAEKKWGAVRPLEAVGYAQCVAYLKGVPPEGRKLRPGLPGLHDEIVLATRQLVKRQRTWFKGIDGAERFTLPSEANLVNDRLQEIYEAL